jgi:hypothetical protein
MSRPLQISAQATPNPNAAKFTLNRVVAAQGATYRDAAAAPAWAQAILRVPGITQVFALNNFVSVTKTGDARWDVVGPQVEAALRQAFAEAGGTGA